MAPRTRSQTRSPEFSKLSLEKSSKGSPKTSDRVVKGSLQRRSKNATPTRSSSNHRSPRTSHNNLSARALSNKTSGELQSLCALHKVSGKGTKDVLTQRLMSMNQNTNNNKCHAILVTESKIPGRQGTFSDAKGALFEALEQDILLVKDIKGQVFVANQDAVKYAEAKMDMVEIQTRLDDNKDKLHEANNLANAKDNQIKMLQDRLIHMSRQLDLHEILRNRFISSYKRLELNSKEFSDKIAVEIGNEKVHSGDAVLDAYLFRPGSRDDVDAYKSLYGMTPSEVLDIDMLGHRETLSLINRNATIAASRRDKYTKAMRKAFGTFMKLFRESDFDQNYMLPERCNQPLRRAYDQFWKCAGRRILW